MAHGVAQQDQDQSQGHINNNGDNCPLNWSVCVHSHSVHIYILEPFRCLCMAAGTSRVLDGFVCAQARHAHRGLVDVCV